MPKDQEVNPLLIDGVLTPELVDADSIEPHPDNPNNGDEEAVSESMEINGIYRTIYVQRSTRRIVGGHTTWAAQVGLGATKVAVTFLDIDDDTALRILAVDNAAARAARMDQHAELRMLEKIAARPKALLGTAYTDRDLERLRKLAEITPNYDSIHDKPEGWPTLFLCVPKHLKEAFYEMTDEALGDHERLELLLRLAGWRDPR
jgi:hypothetical protein